MAMIMFTSSVKKSIDYVFALHTNVDECEDDALNCRDVLIRKVVLVHRTSIFQILLVPNLYDTNPELIRFSNLLKNHTHLKDDQIA